MLKHLSIKHYALIESLEIEFHSGLNMLTGETGSGKSIVLGALGLLLGERADTKAVQSGKQKCIVEGHFAVKNLSLQEFFEKQDLDYEVITSIRREVLTTGKSRAFVNDTPVKVQVLKELGMRLIDIHSQHQSIQVADPAFQLGVLDRFAGNAKERRQYRLSFREYTKTRGDVQKLVEEDRLKRKEHEFNKFQLSELEALALDAIDEGELNEKLSVLGNAEDIQQGLSSALQLLAEGDENLLDTAARMRQALSGIAEHSRQYAEMAGRLESVFIELKDLQAEMDMALVNVEVDPGELEQLESLQSRIFAQEKKHGLSGVGALLEFRDKLRKEVEQVESYGEQIAELQKVLKTKQAELMACVEKLRKSRKLAHEKLAAGITALLGTLNMPQARFEVEMRALHEPQQHGMDKLDFMFTANAGQDLRPLKEVASGGELSRLMLAIKHASAKGDPKGSIVFDEIDTGVSGEVARRMGQIMSDMSKGMQVICITHLPQIAAMGERHFKVYKESSDGEMTRTYIHQLDEGQRIEELAEMLSGNKRTAAAIANAKDLLGIQEGRTA